MVECKEEMLDHIEAILPNPMAEIRDCLSNIGLNVVAEILRLLL